MIELIQFLNRWNNTKDTIQSAEKIKASDIDIDNLWKQLMISKIEALRITEHEYDDLRIEKNMKIKKDAYLISRSREIDFFVIRNILLIQTVNAELAKILINSEEFKKKSERFKSKYRIDYIKNSLK